MASVTLVQVGFLAPQSKHCCHVSDHVQAADASRHKRMSGKAATTMLTLLGFWDLRWANVAWVWAFVGSMMVSIPPRSRSRAMGDAFPEDVRMRARGSGSHLQSTS